MKTDNLLVDKALAPFAKELGNSFSKVVNDIRSLLGREEKKGNIEVKDGEWKASGKFVLTRKDGNKLQLPPNSPASILLCFGMRIQELAKSGSFDIEATLPEACKAWVQQHSLSKEEPAKETADKKA